MLDQAAKKAVLRLFTYGLWAGGAFAIGVGLLPVVGSLVWAMSARLRARDERVLFGLLVVAVVGLLVNAVTVWLLHGAAGPNLNRQDARNTRRTEEGRSGGSRQRKTLCG